MTHIPNDILEYIKRIYPQNEYLETVDYLPDGLKYTYKEIIPKIVEEIRQKCEVDIYINWNLLFESALPIEIHFPKGKFNTRLSPKEKLEMGLDFLYVKYIIMSTIGPFMDYQEWTTCYLDANERLKFNEKVVSIPEECIRLDKYIKQISDTNKIKSIPKEILNMQVPGMKGKNKGGNPPTIFNCLFENTW